MRLLDQLDGRVRGGNRLTSGTKDELADRLDGAGCPACRVAAESERRWFSAYENEAHSDPGMRDRLRWSFGFCPSHTRGLLGLGPSSSWLAKSLFADVAHAGHRALSTTRPVALAVCPACSVIQARVDGFLAVLADGLDDPHVAGVYTDSDGLCVTHTRAFLETVRPAPGRLVATVLRDRLDHAADHAGDGVVRWLVGIDRDGQRRADLRVEASGVLAAEEAARQDSLASYIELVLGSECCPLCAAGVRAEWRYLAWLHRANSHAAGLGHEATLCVRHLADFASSEPPGSAAAVLGHNAGLWRHEFDRYLDQAAGLPTGGLTDRLVRAARPGWYARSAARRVGEWFSCRVCSVRADAVRRERRLVTVITAHPAYSRRLDTAHGLCLRHGLTADVPRTWVELLRSRLALLADQLDESERKDGWDARWEVKGAEMTAWTRAPSLLDGDIHGPALPAT